MVKCVEKRGKNSLFAVKRKLFDSKGNAII